ncbi:MAG TPA: glycosyltransferase family 2 protein [Candidatus Peribacterales bacterium]|nr:glycosyltransferase family 2 protein [Candidatus Peribacterales bacterium]
MQDPLLTIIVPVYNEERTIAKVMERIVATNREAEILYVDDGSSDTSLAILRKNARAEDSVLTKVNGGKGSAIRHAIPSAKGLFTVIQDADLEYDPKEIALLLAEAKQHPGSTVFGSRFRRANPNLYKRYLLGNKVVTFILNLLFRGKITDSYTCYKLFPTAILRTLPLSAVGFEIEAELCAYTLQKGIPIIEVPISYFPRGLQEGKKIRFRDALKGIATMVKIRFS